MKKKLLGSFAILAVAGAAAFNMQMNSKGSGLSDMSLANVEALARWEIDIPPLCRNTCTGAEWCECWYIWPDGDMDVYPGEFYL